MAGDDWSREEVEATVGDYFAMLRDELAGLPINKAEHNERLRRLLRSRSKGSRGTTGLGKCFPFNVTVNEVRCSQARPREFHLYRVFNFGPDARLYMLPGELSRSCHLDPTQYRAFVHHSR